MNGATVIPMSHQDMMESAVTINPEQSYAMKHLKARVARLEKILQRSNAVVLDDDGVDGACSGLCLTYFAELVSLAGLKEVIYSRRPAVKWSWFVIFISCIILTVYYMFCTILQYIHEPTATKVKIVQLERYEYPTILLCPDTWLDTDKALAAGATKEALIYGLGYLTNYYLRPPSVKIDDYAKAKEEFLRWFRESKQPNVIELFKDVALDSERFLYKCPYCAYRNFSKVLMDETICYQIPFESMSQMGTAREATDLLEVIVPDRTQKLLKKKRYWRLYVEPDLTIGVSTVRFAQIFPGHSQTVRFTPARFRSIPQHHDQCVPLSEPTVQYSPIECALRCSARNRSCIDVGETRADLLTTDLSRLCHSLPPDFEARKNQIRRDDDLLNRIPRSCFDECPPLCERWLYDPDVESHIISTPMPKKHRTDNSSVLTRIYFLNQAPMQGGIVSYEEVPTYTWETFVGNIGGLLGLWIGASILTFVQLIAFLITWFVQRITRNRRRRKILK